MAISMEGPGLVSWMMITGFFAMSAKFAEITLAFRRRTEESMISGDDWDNDYSRTKHRFLRYIFDNDTINQTLDNFTRTTIEWTNQHSNTYIIVPLLCVLLCTIATIINARILLCVKWIRRPLSPTLLISLSLALADTCSAILIGLGFVFNSLLPKGLNINVDNDCVSLIIEALRLSGILISTIHLLVLAGNHYFGILCPFRSMRWLTHANLIIVVVFTWIAPTAYIFGYFGSFENQGFQRKDCHIEESKNFLSFSRFRTIFSALFFIPLILMCAIYIHISIIVRKHQASRKWFNRHSRRLDNTGSRSDQQKQFDRNLKAIWTSLLILSTYLICFMPAVLHFYLICRDCYIKFESISTGNLILTSSITNFLLITKYLLNPLIYASRMHDIRSATKQMNAECRRRFCNFATSNNIERGISFDNGTQRISMFSGSSKRNNIGLNSIHLKNGTPKATKKLEATNL